MGKMYTFDSKLLVDRPEIRIGDKVYPVDDRAKTVKQMMKLVEQDGASMETIDAVLQIGLGERAYHEIDEMELSFSGYRALMELVIAAMTGEEADGGTDRFPAAAN